MSQHVLVAIAVTRLEIDAAGPARDAETAR